MKRNNNNSRKNKKKEKMCVLEMCVRVWVVWWCTQARHQLKWINRTPTHMLNWLKTLFFYAFNVGSDKRLLFECDVTFVITGLMFFLSLMTSDVDIQSCSMTSQWAFSYYTIHILRTWANIGGIEGLLSSA